MVVGNDRNPFFAGEPRGVRPSCGLPIVFAFFLWNPGRQRLVQVIGQRINVGLVHLAKLGEFAVRLFPVMKFHAVLGKDIPDLAQVLRGQAVVRQRLGSRSKYLRKIDDGVTSDRESEFRLSFTSSLDTNDGKGASVENRGERSDPGLVVVLRAKIGQHGIREMALHQFGAPKFPILEENAKRVLAVHVAVAAKQLSSSGRRAGARIEERNVYLAFGE